MGMKTLPWEQRGEARLKASLLLLEKHVERAWRDLETPTERMIICSYDLCIWLHRKFQFKTRRYVRRGATKGIRIVQLGWVLLSFRY